MTGKIKSVNSKGFGFIKTEEDIDFFFHRSGYAGDWRRLVHYWVALEGEAFLAVDFIVDKDSDKGPRAINVKLTNVNEEAL